jgi:hypothetical protein
MFEALCVLALRWRCLLDYLPKMTTNFVMMKVTRHGEVVMIR